MTYSVLLWIAAPLLVFWSIGAYNRLMRLRAEANAAFALLDAEFTRQVEFVQASMPPAETQPASLEGGEPVMFWSGLQGAAKQFAASLAVARNRPLDAGGIAALSAAQDVMAMAWERVQREDAHDLAGARLPDTFVARRAQMAMQTEANAQQFNLAVDRYNAGISQFPAVLLAWLFGFRRAQPIRVRA